MDIYICTLNKSNDSRCEFCGSIITGYEFNVDAYDNSKESPYDSLFRDNRQIICCADCATLITGKDTSERVRVRREYDARAENFLNTPWNPTSNPLVVVKVWRGHLVSIMRDKFGRKHFGVLIGKAERWNRREKLSRYERSEETAITDMRTAECIAFLWINFVDYYSVKPEDPYTVNDFIRLAGYFKRGLLPDDKPRGGKNWWEK